MSRSAGNFLLFFKEPGFQHGAQGVVDGQMQLLHVRRRIGRGHNGAVAQGFEPAAAAAGEADDGKAQRLGGTGGQTHIFGVAAGADAEEHVLRLCTGHHLLGGAEQRVQILQRTPDGEIKPSPFTSTED